MTADRPDGDDRVWKLSALEFMQMMCDDWPDPSDEDNDADDDDADADAADAQRQESDTRSEYRVDGEDLQ